MPKTVRDIMKRHLAQAYHDLDLPGNHINTVEDSFRKDHPELADGLLAALELIAQIELVLDAFAELSWGYTGMDWSKWRMTGKKEEDDISDRIDAHVYGELTVPPVLE